jgi:tetratricopeptide (TPR) repeat protein
MVEEPLTVQPAREVVDQVWPLIEAGRTEEALALLDDRLTHPPFSSMVPVLKAMLLQRLNRLEEALACYDLALAMESNASGPYYTARGAEDTRLRRAELLEDLGHTEEAVQAYEEALAYNQEDIVLHTCRGRLLAQLERYPEALAECERAIELAPVQGEELELPYGYLLMNKANVLSFLGRCREALSLYTQAEKDRQIKGLLRRALLFNLGCTLAQLARYEQALALFQESIEQYPAGVLAYLAKGEVEQALGREKEAETTYARLAGLVSAERYAELPALRQEVGRGVWEARVDVRPIYISP